MGSKIKHLELWKRLKLEENPKNKLRITNQLIEIYYPLVKKIAYKLANRFNWKVSPDDLCSFGIDGLYISIRRFDIDKNIKFESYANLRIRGSMIDGMRREDKIPRSVRINSNLFEKKKIELEIKKKRPVSEIEIFKALGIKEKDYSKTIKKFNPVTFSSFDGSDLISTNSDFHQDFDEDLIDSSILDPDSDLKKKEFFNKLVGKGFTLLERKIIYLYYYENLTMSLIGEIVNMSESRVSQLHGDLLFKLKNKILKNPNYFSNDIYDFIKTTSKN